jgi:peroxiredoxin
MTVQAGEKAKEIALDDQDGEEIHLSDFSGRKVLLSFHPLAWTPICAQQMKSLEKNRAHFEKLNTVPLGLSVDTVPSKKAWAKELNIKDTRLLSDFWPHGEAAMSYGIFREKEGFSERANIIVDENGKVIFVRVYPISQLPDIDEIIRVLE